MRRTSAQHVVAPLGGTGGSGQDGEGAPTRDALAGQEAAWRIPPRGAVARDPTRKLSYVSCVGYYSSIKMGLRYPFESLPEREAMVLLDVDPDVDSFGSQPETFHWRADGKPRTYTPDLIVNYVEGWTEYVGVKPLRQARKDPDLAGRLERIQSECAARGARFRTWHDTEIRSGCRLSNAKRVVAGHAYLRDASAGAKVASLRAAVRMEGLPSTVGDLIASAGGDREIEGYLLGLVAIGEMSVDLGRWIDDLSVVHRGVGNPRR